MTFVKKTDSTHGMVDYDSSDAAVNSATIADTDQLRAALTDEDDSGTDFKRLRRRLNACEQVYSLADTEPEQAGRFVPAVAEALATELNRAYGTAAEQMVLSRVSRRIQAVPSRQSPRSPVRSWSKLCRRTTIHWSGYLRFLRRVSDRARRGQ